MRIFLVVALVLAGCIGVVRVLDGGPSDAATAPLDTTVAPTTIATTVPVASTDPVAAGTTAPAGTLPAELSSYCPTGNHAAVIDRDRQLAWLCESGTAVYEFAFTGAISQPDSGTYAVYAKDLNSSSTSSKGVSTMTHFVAFTYGKFRGARIAFHSMPVWASNGEWVQPLDSIGDLSRRGESAGCLRVLPDDAVKVWDWLSTGDDVRVIN